MQYLLLYAACFALERAALYRLSGLVSFLLLAICAVMTRFAPGMMTAAYLVASTSVSDFIAAMKRMHLSEKIIISLSVIFRFFPTIGEITFGCENLGMPKEEILRRLDRTVSALWLEPLLDRRIFGLSGGEKQKIACAGAFMMEPQVFTESVLDSSSSACRMRMSPPPGKFSPSWT